MGNQIGICCRQPEIGVGKVLLPDGNVHRFHQSISVAEIMVEHPQQFVFEFRSLLSEKRPVPLRADQELEVDNTYALLPMKRCKVPERAKDEARRILSNTMSRSFSVPQASGKIFSTFSRFLLQNRKATVSIEKDESPVFEQWAHSPVKLPETILQPLEFQNREFSGRGWKPNLDTIDEKVIERKVPHWLY